MNTSAEAKIQPFLDHYSVYDSWKTYVEAFDSFAKLLHPDNTCYLLTTPWQEAYEAQLKSTDPELWDWYEWWLYDTQEGTISGEYSLEDEYGNVTWYDVKDHSLRVFLLNIVDRLS